MRLNKYLADCGVASRRGCDAIIAQGRIKINGKTVTQLGIDVNPDNDTVSLDGKKTETQTARRLRYASQAQGSRLHGKGRQRAEKPFWICWT